MPGGRSFVTLLRRMMGVLPTAFVMSSSAPCIMVIGHTMRGPVTASASVAIAVLALGLAGCSFRRPTAPPPRDPPPRVLSVGLDRLALRANAYVELHCW